MPEQVMLESIQTREVERKDTDGYTSPPARFLLFPCVAAVIWAQWVAIGFLLRWLASVFGYSLDWTGGQITAGAVAVTLILVSAQSIKFICWFATGKTKFLEKS